MTDLDRLISPDLGVRLRDHVEKVSGLRHGVDDYFELEKRADYFEEQLRSCRFEVQNQEFHFKANRYRNIIATGEGRRPELPPLLIGAHYDGNVGPPGADDNASGVAVLLEVARTLA